MTPETILVTGAAGFTGRYMCRYLRSILPDNRILGTDICTCVDCNYDEFYTADIGCAEQIGKIIKEQRPKYIIHLAGIFGASDVQTIYGVNLLSTIAIMEAAVNSTPESIIITSGSAAEYGRIDSSQMPIDEDSSCNPVMHYGLSKLYATQAAKYYHRVYGLTTMIVRPFQLIGRNVSPKLAPGAFAQRLIEAKKQGDKEIKVGNLQSSRDFLDAEDAVRAIWMLCQKPAPGEVFNLCSGKPITMEKLLDLMIKHSGCSVSPVEDQQYLKGKAEVNVVYGSFEKINRHCGWEPQISLETSIRSMF